VTRVAAAAGWLGLFALYLTSLPGTFYFEDGPELLSCAAVLGNTHPPGYPLLMLAGRLALGLPVGGPGFRFNLLVAACGAGAAVLLGLLTVRAVSRLGARPRPVPGMFLLGAGALAAGVWGCSDTFWWEAVIGDKYAPYYLGWLAAGVAAVTALSCDLSGLARAWAGAGLALGLALAVHQYAVFVLPLAAVAAARAAVMRAFGARVRLRRIGVLAGIFVLLPLSTRVLYPPLRSRGGAALDWGRPATETRLTPYLTGALYHQVFAATSLPRNPGMWTARLTLAGRLLTEEIPAPVLVGALPGVPVLAASAPLVATGLGGCAAADAFYAANFSEKIVRWWEPAYAVLVLATAVGFAWALLKAGPAGAWWMAALALGACGMQVRRGWDRNALADFAAAHDLARNVLRSLPPGAVYLGAGDYDLFPLWALDLVDGERPDVTAAGLAAYADPRLAVSGRERRLAARFGILGSGRDALAGLLSIKHGPPVYFAAAGYDPRLQAWLPLLKSLRAAGLVGRPERHWDPAGSDADTRRVLRAYTFRNLAYGSRGALGDLDRVRDEVARGALLQYAGCLLTLGRQLASFGMEAESAWALRRARRLMVPLTGPLNPPPPAGWLSPVAAGARADQQAVGLGYLRLADVFDGRGVTFLATQFRENARAALQ